MTLARFLRRRTATAHTHWQIGGHQVQVLHLVHPRQPLVVRRPRRARASMHTLAALTMADIRRSCGGAL